MSLHIRMEEEKHFTSVSSCAVLRCCAFQSRMASEENVKKRYCSGKSSVEVHCTAILAPDLPLALAKATRFSLDELCISRDEILSDAHTDAYSSVRTDQAVVKD